MIVTAAVGARSHADDPAGLGHLIVHLSQSGRHLVGQSSGDNHHVRLTGGRAENDSQAILIVSWGGEVHHLDGTAGQTEGHGPEGRLAGPVGHDVEGRPGGMVLVAAMSGTRGF